MHVPVEEQDEFEEKFWKPTERRFESAEGNIDELAFSSFLRDYLMRDGAYIPTGDTFESFQRHHAGTDFDPIKVAIELRRASAWYDVLRGNGSDASREVDEALSTLRQLDSSTSYALLLNLYQRRHRGQLNEADLAEVLRMLAGFILRRLVCSENSRGYNRMFIQAISALDGPVVDHLKHFLEARGFPDTPRFVQAFVRFNLYGSRYRKAVLEAIERANGHKEPAMLTHAQVEHIMPQTLTDAWRSELGPDADLTHSTYLHTPGNLTLTGYNPELHNKPFAEKRRAYRDSNIVITRQLAEQETWDESQIRKRGEAFAQVAAKIWPGPSAPARRTTHESKIMPSWAEFRLRFWTGFCEHLKAVKSPLETQKPRPYYDLSCGRLAPRITLFGYVTLKYEWISVGALFEGQPRREIFHALREQRDAIEAEIGAKLIWNHGPDLNICEIVLRNPVDPTDELLWPTYFDWMHRTLETFQRVIGPRIPDKTKVADPEGDGNANSLFRIEYWTAFRDHLIHSGSPLKSRKPLGEPCSLFGVGRSGIVLAAWMNRKDRWIATDVIFQGPAARAVYAMLEHDRDALEQDLGESVEWLTVVGDKHSKIRLRLPDSPPSDRSKWPVQHAWLRSNLEDFRRVIVPRILAASTPALESSRDVPGQGAGS